MKRRRFQPFRIILFAAALLALAGVSAVPAAVQTEAGHYRVALTTDPVVVPVGPAKLLLKITDASGQPVGGATVYALAKMPGMDMGEREQPAAPQPSQPGLYRAPAVFAMGGAYNVTIKIAGPHGSVTATTSLQTGQDTGGDRGGSFPWRFLPWLASLIALLFLLYRLRRTGQRPNCRVIVNRQVVSGLLLLALMLGVSSYAVKNFRRAGAMTPIEAQAMEMNTPAPPGTAPVELAAVERGTVESTVRYTGSAVGYAEQEVYPRVTGWIVWMPLYVGDHVRRGQLLARLDTSQSRPQVAERRAALAMAAQGADVARRDYEQALAGIREAHAEVGMRRGALEEAQANVAAARDERTAAQADLAAAQSNVADAQAQLSAAQADQEYWTVELRRTGELQQAGAASREELQREKAQAENAVAKVRQAQARITQVQAQVQAAQARLHKSETMITVAQSKAEQTSSEIAAHDAHVHTAEAGAASARKRIDQAQAGVQQARASLGSATATQGYSEIRSLIDGVVTQRMISPGVLVNPGQAILKVAQVSPIRLQANVAEADLSRLRVGARVRVRTQADTNRSVEARLTSIAPAVDPVARTGVAEALLPNRDGRCLPGAYVEMEITTGRSATGAGSASPLRVPTRAIRWRTSAAGGVLSTGPSAYVWVAEPAGRAGEYTVRTVEVQVGRTDEALTEVRSGLQEGQQVVSAGYDDLRSGDTVMREARHE